MPLVEQAFLIGYNNRCLPDAAGCAWPRSVGEFVECRPSGGRRGCLEPRPPGEGNAGGTPVLRIDIEGGGLVVPELDEWVGGVGAFGFAGIRGK